ncbi:MAG: ComEC/Rec2 family competence protein, partial [Ktedonobacteraceae bacterium]|nr:ComEC/Rec2 family competence protein [Ktedonobacteraceae bacterium]
MATKQRDELYERLRGLLLLPIAGAWLAGIYISALFSWLSTPLLVCAALTLIGTVFSLLSRHKLAWLPLLCLFSLLLGAWRYSMSAPGHDPGAISQLIGIPQLRLRGTVSDEPRFTGRSRTLVVSVDSVNNGSQWLSVTGQIELQVTGTAIEDPYGANYGDSVEITGALQSAPPHSAPDILASMAFPRVHVSSHGGNPLLVYLHHLRITLATLITQSLPQPAAAMLIALVLGLSTPTLKPLTAIFTVTGTTHILVASGFNVTLVSGMVRGAMRWLDTPPGTTGQDLLPAQHQGSWRRWLVTILVLCSIAIYSVLNGAGPAAIRAGIMGALLVLAPRLGRIYNVYTGLATTAVAMSLMNPFILWDIGFQLSFCSTLGIVLFTPHLQRLIQRFIRFPLLGEPLAVTIAAQLATLPIIAITFQQVSLISPIANLLIEPFLGVLTLAGML